MIGVADENSLEKSCRQQSVLSCRNHFAPGADRNEERDIAQQARANPNLF